DLVLSRIIDARLGHFKQEALDQNSFLLGESARSEGAWAQPERWGTWLCEAAGDIRFCLDASGNQSGHVWAWIRIRVCPALQDQPVRLSANGERLWEGRVGQQSKDIMVRIRRPAGVGAHWRVKINAEVTLTPELRAQISTIDSRIPSIGF